MAGEGLDGLHVGVVGARSRVMSVEQDALPAPGRAHDKVALLDPRLPSLQHVDACCSLESARGSMHEVAHMEDVRLPKPHGWSGNGSLETPEEVLFQGILSSIGQTQEQSREFKATPRKLT